MALRPQLKDLNCNGLALDGNLDGKKLKKLQPPMNASPGELRLWKKLNGVLDADEKKAGAAEIIMRPNSRTEVNKQPPAAQQQRRGGVSLFTSPIDWM